MTIRCVYVYPYPSTRRYGAGRLRAYFKDGGSTHHARLVAAIKLRRPLLPTEIVHHKNGDWSDDHFDNLEIISPTEHMRLHPRRTGRACKGCGADVSQRTYGCHKCAVRHNHWRAVGQAFVPAHTIRKDNVQWQAT